VVSESSRRQRWALPLALFALAFAIRCLPWPTVAPGADPASYPGVVFFGSDAWYHMRRVAWGLLHFPQTLGFDSYLDYPHGAVAIWPPLFDQALTWFALPAHALGGIRAAEWAVALAPPLLGAATVVVFLQLAWRLCDAPTARLAALVLAVLSGHFWYTQIGFADHHAAEGLCAAVLLVCAARFVDESSVRGRAAALGVSEAVALLVWPGALIHVALVEAALLVHTITRTDAESAARWSRARAHAHAVALAIVAPFAGVYASAQWNAFDPTVLSAFQPACFAALAVHALACSALWQRGPAASGASAPRRAWTAVALGAAVLALGLVLVPELRASAETAWSWFGKREAFQSRVAESKPLFEVAGRFDVRVAVLRLSAFVFALPLALAAFAVASHRYPRRDARWLVAFWALGMLAATLWQKRFFNTSSLAVALLFAWTLRGLHLRAAALRPRARRASAAAFSLGGLALLAPTFAPYRAALERISSGAPGRSEVAQRRLAHTGYWMRRNTPPTSGYDTPGVRPQYGVLASWDLGHTLLYTSQRPQVVGNFGDDLGDDNFALHLRYFRSTEQRGARLLDSIGARYVVVQTLTPRERAHLGPRMLITRLTAPRPQGLALHRLVFATAVDPPGGAPGYRVFERIGGPARPAPCRGNRTCR